MSNTVPLQQIIESKSDQAYQILEELIVTMELEPGSVVSESGLVEKLRLGRTPVREALQRLATENLVEVMPRRGIRITEINIKQQLRLLEARREVEGLIVRLSTVRSNQAVRLQFGDLAVAMLSAADNDDYSDFLALDREMNELLADASDNEFCANMLQQLHGLSRRFWHKHHLQLNDLKQVANLHAATAQAIADNDEGVAVAASAAHMDYIQSFTLSPLGM